MILRHLRLSRFVLEHFRRGYSSRVIEGHTLYYEEVGSGPTSVLLLPGALGSSRTDFSTILPKFDPNQFTVIAWDPPGYGKSRPPDRTWPARFFDRDANLAMGLMEALRRPRFAAVGWSDGGNTAMVLAALHPGAVDKLVLWGANSYISKEDVALYEQIRTPEQWSPRMRASYELDLGKDYFRRLLDEWCQAMSDYPDGNICRDRLKDIHCPTLLMHGNLDAMVPPFHPDEIENGVPNCRRVDFPDGKHNFHLKYANDFMKEVVAFLDKH